jgi:hypothetical protein
MCSSRRGEASADNEAWSLYGAQWLQPVAIAGKSTAPRNRENKRNPLRPAATGCLRRSMVRRGSTVRVRQRASTRACKWPFFVVLKGNARVHRGYIHGTRDAPRRLATFSDPVHWTASTGLWNEITCKRASSVVSMGENMTPSLQRGGHSESSPVHERRLVPAGVRARANDRMRS